MKKLIEQLKVTINKQKYLVIFIMILFLLGLIIGSLFTSLISKNDQSVLINKVSIFFNDIKKLSTTVMGFSYFKKDLLSNLIQIVLIYVLGLSVIGIIVVIITMFFKGFILGVTLSSIILKYQIKGIIGCILYLLPVYLLKIFLFIFISFFSISASLRFIKGIVKKDAINFKVFLGKYLLSFIISIVLIVILSLLDSYLTPLLLRLFTYI